MIQEKTAQGMGRFCVLLPAYNEAAHLGDTVRGLRTCGGDIVVVDDGSTDTTVQVGREAGARVIVHEHNRGKGAALSTGFAYALEQGYDFVVTMDADGQHDPADLPGFLAAYRSSGTPVVVGNRMALPAGMPLVRRLTNRFMSWLLSRRMGVRVPDTQNGYRLYAREVLPRLTVPATGFAAESEVLIDLADAGIAIGSAPVRVIYRDEKSKINPVRDTVRFFLMLRRHRKPR